MPEGYGWHVVAKWGEPMWSHSIEFDPAARGTGESQELAFGDNNDGMALFQVGGCSVLAVNNKSVNLSIIYGRAVRGRGGRDVPGVEPEGGLTDPRIWQTPATV